MPRGGIRGSIRFLVIQGGHWAPARLPTTGDLGRNIRKTVPLLTVIALGGISRALTGIDRRRLQRTNCRLFVVDQIGLALGLSEIRRGLLPLVRGSILEQPRLLDEAANTGRSTRIRCIELLLDEAIPFIRFFKRQ